METRPVILVHGLLGTPPAHFGACLPWWQQPTVDFGLPGHGPAADDMPEHPTGRAIDDLARLIAQQPVPPLVVGVSYLGATVAFRAAQRCGPSAHGVVLSGYSFEMAEGDLRRWLAAFVRMAADQTATRSHFAELHGDGWPRLVDSAAAEVTAGRLPTPGLADLEAATVPVLLANGALLQAERLAVEPAARSGADVAVIAGAGHLVPRDSPRAFVATVEEFSARIDEGRTVFAHRRAAARQERRERHAAV